ncbi:tyrosine-type recombinase/integrase [Candidatus Bipolaricaulota bacterium]|nr:tyrosine-type recombinase/integrase [Candidatus Bipolaricaulota bacterium]
MESNPLNEINEPKTPDKYPRTITEEQTHKLVRAAKNNKSNWTGQRDYTMLLLFIESGLRLNEMISIRVGDLNFGNHLLTVVGKGNKERNVSFGAKVCKALRKWLARRDELNNIYDENIFLDRGGEALNKRNVQDRINRIQKRAGLGKEKVSPHVLRHTSATLSAKNGMNAAQLRQIYGWKSLETAIKYIHLSGKDVKKAMKEASPIDSL